MPGSQQLPAEPGSRGFLQLAEGEMGFGMFRGFWRQICLTSIRRL